MTFSWNYGFSAKGGQVVKEKKDDIVITNKSPELALKIKIKGFDEKVENVLSEIADQIGNIEDCTLTFSGSETKLKENLKVITKIITEHGGQETLEEYFGQKQKEAAKN